MSKALSMLQKRKSTSERADQYFKSIRRNYEPDNLFKCGWFQILHSLTSYEGSHNLLLGERNGV